MMEFLVVLSDMFLYTQVKRGTELIWEAQMYSEVLLGTSGRGT